MEPILNIIYTDNLGEIKKVKNVTYFIHIIHKRKENN